MENKVRIPLEAARLDGVEMVRTEAGYQLTVPASGGKMIISGRPMQLGGVDWTGMKYLVMEVTGQDELDQAFTVCFMTPAATEGPMCIINAGVLPKVRTKWPIALSLLDSQTMFIPRTPGRLKEIILGRGINLDEAAVMVLSFKKTPMDQHLVIHDFYLTAEKPDCSLTEAMPLVDKLGQFIHKEWPGKTHSEEEMVSALRQERAAIQPDASYEGRSRFGGDLSNKYEGTGFFRTHFDGKRWCLVDPDGYRFVSTGLDCCIPGDAGYVDGIEALLSEMPDKEIFANFEESFDLTVDNDRFGGQYINHSVVNLVRAFGKEWKQAWMEITRARLIKWQFNTIGNWSDKEFVRFAHLPYVWPLADFPTTEAKIFRDFPDVFSEEYTKNCAAFAEQLHEFVGDPYMIGYFLRNEPEWAFVQGLIIADKVLENPADTHCKREMIRFLREKYGDIAALNSAWGKSYQSFEDLQQAQPPVSTFGEKALEDAKDFSRILIRKYVSIPSDACRAVDPDHMNLGMRYAMLLDPILLEGHENFDVFSLNGYDANCFPSIQQAGEMTGKPVIIGEFHFGAPDVGMLAAAICSVAAQEDRGPAYRAYYEGALDSPYFVGAHYFSLNDQPVLGRYDGENCQIGAVDVCVKPYETFTKDVTAVNEEIYALTDGKRSDPKPVVNRIPRMMGF